MSICVARQPIFMANLKVYGYELFFREERVLSKGVSSDTATSETIINSFHDMGIERVTGSKRAFVIFTEKLLRKEVATLLPESLLVIEPERGITPSDEVVAACRELKARGYHFAFDEFVLEPEYARLLPMADFVRFDFAEMPITEIHRRLSGVDTKTFKLLAKKVETNNGFEMAKSAGFQLFQGKFFCKPINIRTDATINPSKIACLQLINLSADLNANYDEMAEIIKRDVALSFMLFRVVNSVYFGLYYTVTGITHALTVLGMSEIRKWVTLISLSRLCDDKPNELISLSLIRARFLEMLAPRAKIRGSADEMFLIGLMSLMDALLDMPLEQVLQKTAISENVSIPLLTGEGERGRLFELVQRYEDADWQAVQIIAEDFGLTMDTVSNCYKEALRWAKRVT